MENNVIRSAYWEIGISENQFDFARDWIYSIQEQEFDMSKITFYGSSGLLWDGGRDVMEDDKINRYVDFITHINNLGMGFNFSAQNVLIGKSQRDDKHTNRFLAILNESGLNGVIVVLDTLKDYVREKYPNLKVISSINKAYIEQGQHASRQWYEKILREYDSCVINGNDMYDIDKLSSISGKDRLILLVNERCHLNCDHRNYHIFMQSMFRLKELKTLYSELIPELHCPGQDGGMLLKKEKLMDYFDSGIVRYKIQGRRHDVSLHRKELEEYFGEYQN